MAIGQLSDFIHHLGSAVLLRQGAELTDGQLLERFVSRREPAALEALVQRHAPMVWGVCRRTLGNLHDAEDAFQATFLVLVRKAAAVYPRAKVGNWLYGVAHQTALKARTTRAKRRVRERPATEMSEPARKEHDLWDELQPLLDQEVSRLPEKYRTVIVLCELEGRTKREAARQLGLPEGTVASRVARARALLAKRLARRGPPVSCGAVVALLAQNAASACVPTAVVSSALKAARLLAAGQAAAAWPVSARVAALAEGVIKTMLLKKVKTLAAVVLILGACGFGGGLLIHTTPAAAQEQDARRQAVPNRGDGVNKDVADGDKADWREMLTMKHEHAITAIACSAEWSVAGDERGKLFAWDTRTGKDRTPINSGWKTIDQLRFTADEKDQYTPDGKSLHVIWGGRMGIARYFVKDKKFEGGHGTGADGVAMGYLSVSADAEVCLEFFREGRGVYLRRNAYVFKMGRFDIRADFDLNQHESVEYKAKVSNALVSAGDKWLAVATEDGTLHIHDRASLREIHTIPAGKEGVVIKDLQFSADGRRIAVARDDGAAKVYDTAKGEEVATLKGGHSGIVFAVAFSPDGKTVVTGGDDNTARVWDAATGKALATLKGHTDSVRCVAFDPSGEILITGSADKTVKLWTAK
jgi:RNA polymerase sigma factor (sigma-70 family)